MRASSALAASLACCLLLWPLSGCRDVPPTAGVAPVDAAAGESSWQRFVAAAAQAEITAGPFRINAVLSYRTEKESQRVSVYCWGNGSPTAPHPIRLDIQGAPGHSSAKALESDDGYLVYIPGTQQAYRGRAGMDLPAFGVPIPFTLEDIALLLNGQYAALLIAPGAGRIPVPPLVTAGRGTFLFRLDNARLPGDVTLDDNGRLLAWSHADNGWRMALRYADDSTRTTPAHVSLTHSRGVAADLAIRQLDRSAPFTPEQLALPLPPGTRLRVAERP